MHLCLDPARHNQVLIRPIHRRPTLNYILPKLTNVHYITIIDACYYDHSMKLNRNSSYLTTFVFQFGRYRFTRLLFGVAPVDDMFQGKYSENVKSLAWMTTEPETGESDIPSTKHKIK